MANLLTALIQAIPAMQAGFKGKNTKSQKRTLGQMQQLADAQINMDNPLYQRLYGQNRDAMQADMAATVAEIGRQNRKLMSMGRNPLLSSERGGEQVFRNLMLGSQDVGERARMNTLNQLGSGANMMANLYSTQGNLAGEDYNNRLRRVGAYYTLGDALGGFMNMNRGA